MPKTIDDRIADVKARQAALAARLGQLQGKARTVERKRDTRRKIVVGAAVIAHMGHDADFAQLVATVLARNVLRPADRDVITELLP